MKPIILTIIVLIMSAGLFGQTPAAVERELIGHLNNVSKYGSYFGGYDAQKLETANSGIKSALTKYGKRADILAYKFPNLGNKMYVATSPDRNLRIYSWDHQDGGTMHNYDNVFQYKAKNGKVYTWSDPSETEGDAGAYYHQMFQTDTPSGPIYLGVSTFVGSTSLRGSSINAFRINGDKLDEPKVIKTRSGLTNSVSFAYDFFNLLDKKSGPSTLFSYDETKKSFRFPIVVEDSKTPQGRVTNRYITYRFDGKYFVKVS